MHPPRDTAKFMAHMQERRAQHLVGLKAKLQLSAAQESAWTAFTAAAQLPSPPPEGRDTKAARAEFDQLTTPQRLDRLQARHSEHAALFAKRADATRSFYAALTPAQKKTFDAEPMSHSGVFGKGGPRGHRGDGGYGDHGRHGSDHGGPDGHRSSPPASPAPTAK